jgi:acetyl-CoA synthetase
MSFDPFPEWYWDIPARFNIGEACLDRHLATPTADRLAMIVEDEQYGTSQATYAELAERTSRFAQLLRNLGVGPGERVLISLPNSLDYPIAFLGTLKRGAIAVPTSTLLSAKEAAYLTQDSTAVVLVTNGKGWKVLGPELEQIPTIRYVLLSRHGDACKSHGKTLLDLDAELDAIGDWEGIHPTAAAEPAYLVYTSGTTSYPKGVLHAHRSLLGRAPASQYWFDFDPAGDRIVHSGKLNWTYVLGSGMMDPFYRAKTVVAYEGKNEAATWPRLIAKHRATIFIGVPTVFRQILQKTAFVKTDVPTLRHCMSAGEHLSDEVFARWRERFGLEIYEAVGMSEFSYYLSQNKWRPIRPGSAGFPQPGHDVRLLDPETLREVPMGEEGMICVPESDPGLFLEYWNLPDEMAKLRHDGWFFTGDYARYDASGYLWFSGRKDDIINSFGYRVSPYEVERVLKSHPAVADCACIGEPVAEGRLVVVAYVILQPWTALSLNDLVHFGREHLASYKAPRRIYLTHDFPRTTNGKILRRQINPKIAVECSTT